MEYLIIDGYNVINAWGDVFDLKNETLEECRNKLLNILSNYQGYKKINTIVVFDAHLVKGSQEKQEIFDNLTVVFTRENETADNYIEKFVHKLGNTCTIRVVTSDYLEQTIILSNGGIRMTPWELKEEISLASRRADSGENRKIDRVNTIESRIKPEMLEKLEKMRRSKF
ncbi:MAG: NYN domain-containing protein [Clostridiales bacterium]|jgi:predicted RNA-binding protein with PIN domain|nr:NYN domain-containing protein [Eubacteriales bacterium]MDH7567660.1 NYN domain-containing protein [Clostridiales bacterium]